MSSNFSKFIYYNLIKQHDDKQRRLMQTFFPSMYKENTNAEKKESDRMAKYVENIFEKECKPVILEKCIMVSDFGETTNGAEYFPSEIYTMLGLFHDKSLPILDKWKLKFVKPDPYKDRDTITVGKLKLNDLPREQFIKLFLQYAKSHNLMVRTFDGLLKAYNSEVDKCRKRLIDIDYAKYSKQSFVKDGRYLPELWKHLGTNPKLKGPAFNEENMTDKMKEILDKYPTFKVVNIDMGSIHHFYDNKKTGKKQYLTCEPAEPNSYPRKIILPSRQDSRSQDEFEKLLIEMAKDVMVGKKWYDKDFYLHIANKVRKMHTYILGSSGSGKTELLKLLINQDVSDYKSVFVLDPHGDFANQVARFSVFTRDLEESITIYEHEIAKNRKENVEAQLKYEDYYLNIIKNLKIYTEEKKVTNFRDLLVYISPEYADYDMYPCYNPLEHNYNSLPETQRRNKLSFKIGQLVSAFEVIFESDFTHNMYLLVFNCLRLLMEKENSTLLDLIDLMQPKKANIHLTDANKHWDPVLVDYFENIYPLDRLNPTKSAVYTRFAQAFTNQILKIILTQRKSTFNPMDLLDKGKSVIVNLSQGYFTEVGTKIFGSFLTAALTSHGLNRSTIPENSRVPIYAYLDECQNFLSSNIDKTLEELRKYKIHLTLANQHLGQFRGQAKLKDSILANTSIKFCGKASIDDQKKLSKYIGIDITELPKLKVGDFVVRTDPNKDPILFHAFSHLVEDIDRKQKTSKYMKRDTWKEVQKEQLKKYYRKITPSSPQQQAASKQTIDHEGAYSPPKPNKLI